MCCSPPDRLLVAVDTLAEDAQTGCHSVDAKILLIPQHNVVMACRGSAQFFLKIYDLTLQASFRRFRFGVADGGDRTDGGPFVANLPSSRRRV